MKVHNAISFVAVDNDDSKWAWDTRPLDGGEPRRVYIGNMHDWDLTETKRRRDTNREPWGGVWTKPLTPGATKAKWGTRTFDSGRYRCCHDLADCGVFVSVKQGSKKAWCFARQWNYGNNRDYIWKCKHESSYKGPTRFHNVVVNEIHRKLKRERTFQGKVIKDLQKERSVAKLNSLEPDVYVELDDGTWFAIEVVLTHAPEREPHETYGTNMIEINLNELEAIEDDSAFSLWIQSGELFDLLAHEATQQQREERFDARNNEWQRKDERKFRIAVSLRISECCKKFGFILPIVVDSISKVEEIDQIFEEEKERRQLLEAIESAILKYVEKFGERLDRKASEFSSVQEVNAFYENHFKERIKKERAQMKLEKRLLREELANLKKELEEELGINIRKNFTTLDEFHEFATQKRHEIEQKRFRDELMPLKEELEEELGISIKKRFRNLEDFLSYAHRKRSEAANHRTEKQLIIDIKAEYEEKIKVLEEEYETFLNVPNGSTYEELLSRFKLFERQAKYLSKQEFVYNTWTDGAYHKCREGPFARRCELSPLVDGVCKRTDKHTCNHYDGDEAKLLIKRISSDMYDPKCGMKTPKQHAKDLDRKKKEEQQRIKKEEQQRIKKEEQKQWQAGQRQKEGRKLKLAGVQAKQDKSDEKDLKDRQDREHQAAQDKHHEKEEDARQKKRTDSKDSRKRMKDLKEQVGKNRNESRRS